MDEILGSHCIAPELLRTDKFWEFYAARAEALLQRIESATGKSITREPELFRAGVVVEAYDEGPEEEWDAEDPLEEAASMRLPPYPKYKPSGVEWLGEVPEHWDVKRLKMAVHLTDKKVERRRGESSALHWHDGESLESWTRTRSLTATSTEVVPTATADGSR